MPENDGVPSREDPKRRASAGARELQPWISAPARPSTAAAAAGGSAFLQSSSLRRSQGVDPVNSSPGGDVSGALRRASDRASGVSGGKGKEPATAFFRTAPTKMAPPPLASVIRSASRTSSWHSPAARSQHGSGEVQGGGDGGCASSTCVPVSARGRSPASRGVVPGGGTQQHGGVFVDAQDATAVGMTLDHCLCGLLLLVCFNPGCARLLRDVFHLCTHAFYALHVRPPPVHVHPPCLAAAIPASKCEAGARQMCAVYACLMSVLHIQRLGALLTYISSSLAEVPGQICAVYACLAVRACLMCPPYMSSSSGRCWPVCTQPGTHSAWRC